ncbi:hypothetical protein BYI23_F000220 (plasmid) [Burkholderia sp. YI23]|nr:hypothetical protein BYI23_F000220 [Burkholderia sp. YI23]
MPTGCAHCWPASPDAAWEARRDLRELAMWVDETHFNVRGLQCVHCARRFISVFTETIDWINGDDAQSWTTVPVTAEEFMRVQAALASSIEAALRVVPAERRSLRRDHPSGQACQIGWTSGIDVRCHD